MDHLFQDEFFIPDVDSEYFQIKNIQPQDISRLAMICSWFLDKIDHLFHIEHITVAYINSDNNTLIIKYKYGYDRDKIKEYKIPVEVFFAEEEVFHEWLREQEKIKEEKEKQYKLEREKQEQEKAKLKRYEEYLKLKNEFE